MTMTASFLPRPAAGSLLLDGKPVLGHALGLSKRARARMNSVEAAWAAKELLAHGQRAGWLAFHMCAVLGLEKAPTRLIVNAALTHDVGKCALPQGLLAKPSRLTREERKQIQQHSALGAAMLLEYEWAATDLKSTAVEVAMLHHERWDGAGYPLGIAGAEIPLSARVVAVADVFDALSVARAYKPAWRRDAVLQYIGAGRGRQFDPDCVDALMAVLALMPQDWSSLSWGHGPW